MNHIKLWLFLTFVLLFVSCEEAISTKRPKRQLSLNEVVINNLAMKSYMNDDFALQTIGDVFRFEHADFRNEMLYLSQPLEAGIHQFGQICRDTSKLEYSLPVNGVSHLPPGQLRDSTRLLLRFPFEYLKIDTTNTVQTNLGGYTYSLSLNELRDLCMAKTLYDSPALAIWEGNNDSPSSIANHSAPIARNGEPTLADLVSQIIPDSTLPKEVKAQKLLDFVTHEIEYQDHGKYEIFMKPHEVLLSGRSDCSGKVVLYASLLEQMNIPYILVYLSNHICVGISGNFPLDNEMNFEQEGKEYFIAETTTEGFQIGKTFLMEQITQDRFVFFQKPGYQTKLYDIQRGDSLEFVMIDVEE